MKLKCTDTKEKRTETKKNHQDKDKDTLISNTPISKLDLNPYLNPYSNGRATRGSGWLCHSLTWCTREDLQDIAVAEARSVS
jgi:hypothetical protein